ncbi:MAG: phenylalanine--tRNA ligase subunit beta [Actinomycetota bacterium]|nr:phenylalanine--tRNA ligase subunit beta [Actinomycetota bacterium]
MKVLLSWLREFAPIDGDPVELGEQLSGLGLAVEEMHRLDEGIGDMIVARVLDLRPHPSADRIQLVDVDTGDGEALQICCGAFNMAVGDLVPLAPVGATMPDGMEIGRRKMRGEWSNGMLCSSRELGLGADHAGILVLDPAAEVGRPVVDALGLSGDVLYDLEVNPNRPDAMSVAGVARDLAARLGVPFSLPDPKVPTAGADAAELASVEIVDADLCGRFEVRVLSGIEIGPSPRWLADRLTRVGMRPINNVVDVSNYVMLELGRPSHTFDLDKVPGGYLRVLRASGGETIVTLDEQERTLVAGDGVICDRDGTPVSIAGIMGGASTEISDTTTSVLLEMAWWDPPTIARTSRRLGLRSEASARFERGVDTDTADLAMRRFAELLGATIHPGAIDERGDLPTSPVVRLRTSRVNDLLGTDLSPQQVRGQLDPIGFATTPAGDDTDVAIPTFRPDSATEIDLVEEVARMYGYDRIARTVPSSFRTGSLTPRQQARRRLRRTLVGLGMSEAMPLPFLAPADVARAGLDPETIDIANPLVAEESVMRPSLRPGLLRAVAYNASHRIAGARLFEIGQVWAPASDVASPLPSEREVLGVILDDVEAPAAVEVWSVLARSLGLDDRAIVAGEVPGLHPSRAAWIERDGRRIGALGEVDPTVLEAYEAPGRVAWLELDLGEVLGDEPDYAMYRPISRYPSSDIDLAFVVAEDLPAAAVGTTLREAGGDLVASVELFDVYRGAQLGADRRSLAFSVRLQAHDRTLTDAEVAEIRTALIAAVEAAHDATLR